MIKTISYEAIQETCEFIKKNTTIQPKVGIILGSGLGNLVEQFENGEIIPYSDIPNFPVSTVEGHSGNLVFGKLEGVPIVGMQGRFHFYEGYSLHEVTFPVRVMKFLGVTHLIVTNAAGGLNRFYSVGDLMLIDDHINYLGTNPLMGGNDSRIGPRFPDMSQAYTPELVCLAEKIAKENNIKVQKGVYVATTGPSYETPSELRFFRMIGGDAVGMSTVPEVIVGRHCGIENVLGISCITNMATGLSTHKETHEAVIKAAAEAKPRFETLIKKIVKELS